MKKAISLILSLSLISSVSFADCDFATMVKKLDDGTFNYSKECHIKNGENVRDLGIANQQVEKLNQAIVLKDTAISKADERAEMWKGAAIKMDDRITTAENMQNTNKWLYFGVGFLSAIAAVYGAKQLR